MGPVFVTFTVCAQRSITRYLLGIFVLFCVRIPASPPCQALPETLPQWTNQLRCFKGISINQQPLPGGTPPILNAALKPATNHCIQFQETIPNSTIPSVVSLYIQWEIALTLGSFAQSAITSNEWLDVTHPSGCHVCVHRPPMSKPTGTHSMSNWTR